ncbi:uncharacterized protein DFL_008956 [Arthrobotrys flagrans]|uniref:Dynamin N-terminal domain-containing protein n=1 Tax=Arthrobotrys flagrans TaxID=97331 RepID=A0A436ZQB1_ARTFL|nr:hypothetical protein DFL_008956 [Arthrobotrys flagrans]
MVELSRDAPSVTTYASQMGTRPEDMYQAQSQYPSELSQQSSPPHPHHPLYPPPSSNFYLPIISSSSEGNPEEKAFNMVNLQKTLAPQTSLASLGGEVGDLHLSGGRVVTAIAAGQKRKMLDNQPQRESPQVSKMETTSKGVVNPLECERAKERARKGQFAVHSELSAGGILQSQLSSCKGLLEDLGKILGKLPGNRQDAHAKDIQEDIKKFLSCGIEGGGIVGFLGEVGGGKSTLLNALLDLEDFIPTGDEGKCMPIILEFARSKEGLEPFTLDVKYVTKAQLQEDAELWFGEIYVEDAKLQRPTTREAKAISRRFNHLFPGAKWSTLSDVYDQIDKLFAEDEALKRGDGLIHGMDEEECGGRLRDLTVSFSKDRPTEPERWPLVDKIRIYLDSKILNTGAVLADIPGIDDDGTRVKVMQKYLSGVQDIIIVTELKNIFADNVDTLKKIGYEGVTFLDGRSRGVIVTNHLDEYTPKQAKALFKKNKPFMDSFDKAADDLKHAQNQLSFANRGDRKREKAQMAALAQQHEKTLEEICSAILDDFIEPQATVTFGSTIPTDDISWQVFRVDPIAYTKSKKDDNTFLDHVRDDMNIQQMVEFQDYIGATAYPRQFRLAVFRMREAQSIIANLIFWSSCEVKLPIIIQSTLETNIRHSVVKLEAEMDAVRVEICQNISKSLANAYAHVEITVYEATEKAQYKITHMTETINTMRFVCRAGGEIEGTDWNFKLLEEVRERMCDLWKDTITFTVQMMNTFQTRYYESMEAIEIHFTKLINEQEIDNTLKTAFKNLVTKEFLNARSRMVEMCRDNVREIHNMFRHGARTFLRTDTLKELM